VTNDDSASPSTQPDYDRLLRAEEAAKLLGIGKRTVWQLRSRGDLPAVAIGGATRFRMSDIQKLIANGGPERTR
jgi:excisionase family DNA binding protein